VTKKILILGVAIIMALGLFACGDKIPYNAVMYSNANDWMSEEFLKEKITRGSHYRNEEGEMVSADGESYPKTNTFIFLTSEEFEKAFDEFPHEIDFEKEMLILHMFTAMTGSQPYNIASLSLDGTIIMVEYKLQRYSGNGDVATAPGQRCLLVKMDKLEITLAEFTKK